MKPAQDGVDHDRSHPPVVSLMPLFIFSRQTYCYDQRAIPFTHPRQQYCYPRLRHPPRLYPAPTSLPPSQPSAVLTSRTGSPFPAHLQAPYPAKSIWWSSKSLPA